MTRTRLVIALAALVYSAVMYTAHLLIDNAGADVGTAARVVYRLEVDPSFIFTIDQDRVYWSLDESATEDERLRNATYVCGPKFLVYGAGAVVFRAMRLVWPGADPLSALFFMNLAFLFGTCALVYIILVQSGDFSSKTFFAMAPALLLSLPATYFLVFYPTYLYMLTFLMLSGIYLVIRSFKAERHGSGMLLAAGAIFGATIGAGSQAVVCIYAGFVFTGLLACFRRRLISSILLLSAGAAVAVLASELLFQAHGASLLKWLWNHTHENVYDNHLKEPFPFIPFVYFRTLWALLPLTLAAFIGGLSLVMSWRASLTPAGKSLIACLCVVLVTLSVLPATPLFRVFFPFFILMQAVVFMMAMNTRWKAARYALIAMLLLETAAAVPSALFIKTVPAEYKYAILQFEDERKIIEYFNYGHPGR